MNETPETITAWANETFGPDVSPLRCAVRANLEMAELITAVTGNAPKELIAEECADVCIVLWRLIPLLGSTLDPTELVDYAFDSPQDCVLSANEGLSTLMNSLIRRGYLAGNGLTFMLRCLHTCATLSEFDLQAEINRKMQINRARQWTRDGTGIGYHVKTTA